MNTLTDHSLAFAKILGMIFLAGGLNALFSRKAMSTAIGGVTENLALFWVWGFINLLFGATIVALYSTWSSDWRVIVTISGWAGVIKGAFLMLFPNSAIGLYRASNKPRVLTVSGIIAMLLGLLLLYFGFGG